MLKLGLTGGIGAGKSAVAALLRDAGVATLDADALAHASYAKGERGFELLTERFGAQIQTPDGDIDRRKLRELAFADGAARDALEQIVWPLVKQRIEREFARASSKKDDLTAVEAALLFEADWARMFDRIWIVEAPLEKIIDRATAVGKDPADLSRAASRQLDADQRTRLAEMSGRPLDFIWNDGAIDDLRKAVNAALGRIL